MEVFVQAVSTTAILVLLGVTGYLSLPKYRQTAQAVCHLLFRWFFVLLLGIFVMRILLLFDADLLSLQRNVNSAVFSICVVGVTWSVAKYERTNKR